MKTRILFSVLVFSLLAVMPACKKDLIDPPVVDPPKDTTYTLTYKDGNVPIVNDTLYKRYGDIFDFSWEFKGEQTFEILLNSQHFSSAKTGKQSITVEEQLVFNFLVGGKKVKSQVIVLVSEIPFPVINITTDTSVAYNGTANVSWNIQYSTVRYLNSTQIPVSGNLQLASLKRDTVLQFSASNSNGVKYTNKDVTIHVGPPPPPTNKDYLCNHVLPWKHSKEYYKYYEENQFDSLTLSSYELSRRTYFYQNGLRETFKSGHILVGNGPYSINDTILLWGMLYKIIYLDYELMILERTEPYASSPSGEIIWRSVYIRAPEE